MKSVHITSLGCPKNFVDSEVILGLLQNDGWQPVDDPLRADVMLVNTCGFIQPAVEESIEEILGLAEVKQQHPEMKLVVTGCMVQRYEGNLLDEIPEIDMLIGTEGVKDIHLSLRKLFSGQQYPTVHIPDSFLMDASHPRVLATPPFRAWLKITEGCDNRCSYCMIPSIRGRLRSRSIGDLVMEAESLEKGGVKELTLIAQDLTAFGLDQQGDSMLVELLRQLLDHTSIPWIRLLYLYPTGIGDDLLQLMTENPRLLPYLDIPFQHVSTSVLHRMNRPYSHDMLRALVENARRILPDVSLRTTLLLGFPGETENDVEQIAAFLKEMKIDHVGVFAYSNEEGCPSEFFKDQIEEEEKQRRLRYIHELQAEVSEEIQKKYLGRVEDVLVEGVSRESDLLLEGRTRFQAPEIDGCVLINDGHAAAGEIVSVEIEETHTYDLVGAIRRLPSGKERGT